MDLWFLKTPSSDNGENLVEKWMSLRVINQGNEKELEEVMQEIRSNPRFHLVYQTLESLTNQLEATTQQLRSDDDNFTPPVSPYSPFVESSSNITQQLPRHVEITTTTMMIDDTTNTCNSTPATPLSNPASGLTPRTPLHHHSSDASESLSSPVNSEHLLESTDRRTKSVTTPITPLHRKILSDSLFRLDDLPSEIRRRSSCPPKYEKLKKIANSPRKSTL